MSMETTLRPTAGAGSAVVNSTPARLVPARRTDSAATLDANASAASKPSRLSATVLRTAGSLAFTPGWDRVSMVASRLLSSFSRPSTFWLATWVMPLPTTTVWSLVLPTYL